MMPKLRLLADRDADLERVIARARARVFPPEKAGEPGEGWWERNRNTVCVVAMSFASALIGGLVLFLVCLPFLNWGGQ